MLSTLKGMVIFLNNKPSFTSIILLSALRGMVISLNNKSVESIIIRTHRRKTRFII